MNQKQKEGRYERILVQLEELLKKSHDPVARMATLSAVLYHKFDTYFWCGFYRLVEGELVVGPYQGPLACQILEKGKGVCWAGVERNETIVVEDVHQFPGHIACDSRSRSEIVVPFRDAYGHVLGVLDVDSDQPAAFDDTDAVCLEKIVALML